jgi:replicative DNA helicase
MSREKTATPYVISDIGKAHLDLDLERFVLGSAPFSTGNVAYIVDRLIDNFSTPAHMTNRRYIAETYNSGWAIDRSLLSSISVAGDLQKVGGEEYVRGVKSEVPLRVLPLDESDWKIRPATADEIFATGTKSVLNPPTKLGHEIEATANHQFRESSRWKRLGTIRAGDRIAVPTLNFGSSGGLPIGANESANDVYLGEVRSIDPVGVREGFDVTVPGFHNFLANDLVIDNSLEQDRDNIWLIHRPEFYDRNGESLKNKVILILGKQREDEVRDPKLRWNGAYVRFENPPAGGTRP